MAAAAPSDSKPEATWYQTAIAIFCFALGNVSLNYFNSWALGHSDVPGVGRGGFNFPFFYTMFHMAASATAALLLMLTCRKPPPGGLPHLAQLQSYAWQLVPMAVLTMVNNGCNNWSLSLVSLVINQVIKVTAPLPTCLFEYILQGIVYNLQIYLTCCLLVAGAVMAVAANIMASQAEGGSSAGVQVTPLGIAVCVVSLCAASLKPVIQKIIMSGGKALKDKPPLMPEQAMFWDTLIAFFLFLLVWLVVGPEREGSMAYLMGQTANPNSGWVGLGIILSGSTMAFFFNVATYYFIMYTSALTSTIGSLGLKIGILTASGITDHMSAPMAWVGIGLACVAIVLYGFFTWQFKAAAKAQAEAAKATGTTDDPEKADKRETLLKDETTPLVKPG